MTKQKQSRVWLITGCSSGFGRHLSEAVLAKGECVIATARKRDAIQDLERRYPKTAKALHLDVTNKDSIKAALASGLQTFSRVDVLVNNAGYGQRGAIEELSDKQIRDEFETNVFGLLNVTRLVIPIMREQQSGHIINFSSVAGRIALGGMGIYSASKFAVEALSEALAQELQPFGMKITIIEPGGFNTNFTINTVEASHIPEYDEMRAIRAKFFSTMAQGHAPTGMQALLKVVDLPNPPLRLTIGPNSMTRILDKLKSDIDEYQRYKDIWIESAANASKME